MSQRKCDCPPAFHESLDRYDSRQAESGVRTAWTVLLFLYFQHFLTNFSATLWWTRDPAHHIDACPCLSCRKAQSTVRNQPRHWHLELGSPKSASKYGRHCRASPPELVSVPQSAVQFSEALRFISRGTNPVLGYDCPIAGDLQGHSWYLFLHDW